MADETRGAQPSTELLPGSIDQYLTTAVATCLPGDLAADVVSSLAGSQLDTVDDVAVVDLPGPRARLLGLVPAVRLFAADPAVPVRDLMDTPARGRRRHRQRAGGLEGCGTR